MLYKSICTITLTAYAFLITHTFGANYYITASSMVTANDNTCRNATINDTCTFICDQEQWGINNNFNCYDSGKCIITCADEKECFKSSNINATNSNHGLYINVTGSGNDCFKQSNIYLPNYANAIFSISNSPNIGNNRFKEMTIHSGTHTQNISIDCSGSDEKDECKQLIVNAQSAQYLHINVGSGELNGDEKKNDPVIINCPINSTYNTASCVIDASDNGKIEFAQINSINGIPMDVSIRTGTSSIITELSLTCSLGSSFVQNQTLQTSGVCGNVIPTKTPTVTPTTPSILPTITPTNKPSNPSNMPSISPSFLPTKSPSTNPSRTASLLPTKSPTIVPSNTPSLSPSKPPSNIPSLSPSNIPTNTPSNMPTNIPSISPSQFCEPIVSLHGISVYSSTNLNLNGMIDIYSQIVYDKSCRFRYTISWNVVANKLDENDPTPIDIDRKNHLQMYLSESVDMDSLSFDANTYSQPGMVYTFSINLEFIEPEIPIISTTHDLQFDYDDIQCQIVNNDIFLDDIDPETDLNNLLMEINGELLTYDPIVHEYDTEYNHLSWQWDCIMDTINSDKVSCNDLLNSNEQSIVYANFGSFVFDYLSFYSFTFTMRVTDNNNLYRLSCIDYIKIEFVTKSKEAASIAEKLFIVSLTAIKTEINVNERLRLICNIVNYNYLQLLNEGFMEYKWIELNGLLSSEQIQMYKETSDNSTNLILKEHVLEIGNVYSFQLIVSQYSDSTKTHRIGYGISTQITISILETPGIISGSFQVEPACNNKYDSIYQLLLIPHTLSLSADSQYIPLTFQFGYYVNNTKTKKYYYDSFILSDSVLPNIYLSIGDFSIYASVTDSKSSMSMESIQCSIELDSYSECLEFHADLIDPIIEDEAILSISDKYSLILQKARVYIQYLYEYNGNDAGCIQGSLDVILKTINDYIVPTDNILCFTAYPISLSQSISLWMDLITLNKETIDHFYKSEKLTQIKHVLFSILDPCLYITNNILSIEELTVSQYSIVTKIPKIYYKYEDITPYLSPIIRNPNYHHLLYSMASTMIDMFGYLSNQNAHDLYNLLYSALYISELIRVSLSIPGEKTFTEFDGFSLFSIRVNNENINVSVANISVFIPNDITNNNNNNGLPLLFDSVDVLVVGINTSANNVSTIISNSETESITNCDGMEGELYDNSISITVLNNSTDINNLPSNINFAFQCDNEIGCDTTFQCVWLDESDNIWLNDGCNTSIDETNNEILCTCSHLTTFSTIHNIHLLECDNKYLKEWLYSDEWDYFNMIIGIIFLSIGLHTFYTIHPFIKTITHLTWETHRAVFAVFIIGVTAFLYALVCLQSYVTKSNFTVLNIKIYSFLLLLPQITLFLLFSIIFYTWFTLAHGFLTNVHELQLRVRKILVIINICIWILFIIYYILSFITVKQNMFIITAYIWSVLLSIVAVLVIIYSVIVGKRLYYAAQISQHQSFAKNDSKMVRRLLIINIYITLYFIFQCFTHTYLSIKSQLQSVLYSLIYSFIDAIYLSILYYMYKKSINNLIQSTNNEKKMADNLKTRGTISKRSNKKRKVKLKLPMSTNKTTTLTRVVSESVTPSNTKTDISPKLHSNTSISPVNRSPMSTMTLQSPESLPPQIQFTYKTYGSNLNNTKISEEHSDIEIVYDDHNDNDVIEMSKASNPIQLVNPNR